jgi:hypothetical protein
VHDGIVLERRGVVTGVVVTEPFVAAAGAMAALDGRPEYRFAVVPHPTAGMSDDELRAIAVPAAADLEAILLTRVVTDAPAREAR